MSTRSCVRVCSVVLALSASAPALADPLDSFISPKDPAHQVMNWEAGYLALSVVDTAETIECLHQQHGCIEANPLLGSHPSAGKLIAGRIIFGAVHFALVKYINHRNPYAAIRFVQAGVVVEGAIVGLNARLAFK